MQSLSANDSHKFVHGHISSKLARHLGVVPLTECLNISEDVFEDVGQHEPLTTRLKNILRDYKDGLTIIKELLQNADDAEATEVNICYDARQHETDPKKLFFSGMAEAHGPALIVHNNSTFSDDDFKNITKLAGGTKRGKVLKIGKFGIGFSSVYHMTDIPSFISRDYVYIFDPTLSFLKKEVKNPARPGKKTKFAQKYLLGSKQLDPYEGLFGFDRKESYQGTMFRLPFRTHASELSGTCYTEATMEELISAITESSTSLLLFLQHVRTITFHRIDPGQTTPVVLMKITRETVPLPISLSSDIVIRNLSLSCADSTQSKSCQWLVSQNSETNSQQFYQTASVACLLGSSEYKVDSNFMGEIFCFLPLSQRTGLPVHISSNFAVINNRRGIWTSDEATSQADSEVTWNITLMKEVIARAYHALLVGLKEMSNSDLVPDYTFYSVWPQKEKLLQHNPWIFMIEQLYDLVSSDQLFYSASCRRWLHLNESKFLAPGILCRPSVQSSTPACVQNVLQHLSVQVVDLPSSYHSYFNLEAVTMDESAFIELFMKNLNTLKSILKNRSEVVQCMLEVYTSEHDNNLERRGMLEKYFKDYACIPCTPNGSILRKCTEVIDLETTFSELYDLSEGRYPIKELSGRHLAYAALIELGMISKTIPYHMLVERAQSIASLYKTNKPHALRRIRLILVSCARVKNREHAAKKIELSSIPFLPVLPKPDLDYHLNWKGDSSKLMCGKDLMIEGSGWYNESINPDLAGSQVAIINGGSIDKGGCGYVNHEAISILQIKEFPSVNEVLAHFALLQKEFKRSTKDVVLSTDRMCRRVYDFLDEHFRPENGYDEPDSSVMKVLSCVWTGKRFVDVEVIARTSWSIDGPYLYCLPSILSSKENLIRVLNIKEHFSFKDAEKALQTMKYDYGNRPVNERCQNMLIDIVSLLQRLELSASDAHVLMLPDERFVMHLSSKLAYHDVDWALKNSKYTYVNKIVPPHLAAVLGVQPSRSKMLECFGSSFSEVSNDEFGAHENLTVRIQNILRDYPFDSTILMELLQNADDAKATKVYFILDKRTHGDQKVLGNEWGMLQGPALLVCNDSVFSKNDLEGIQKLGFSKKRDDPETIGQHGIGFNVVYHLTDCPSFITGGETMFVLDPHCAFVPGANERFPGRRFDRLSKNKFWELFPDMCDSYLQSGIDNYPPEMKNKTLFRFPLRTTEDHLKNSKIILRNKEGTPFAEPLTSDQMLEMLRSWAPRVREAMLFLNHITEIKYMVIKENSKQLEIIENLQTQIADSDLKSCKRFKKICSSFTKKQGSKSDIIRYPLTITCSSHHSSGQKVSTEEKWLVQQGVGDINNEQQTWSFVKTDKPRHGIAAPLSFSPNSCRGSVYCFLPLPVRSNLPVHINGSFFLNSTRRNLWVSTEEGKEDSRSTWNTQLLQAIASSYVNFLEHAQLFLVSSEPYKTLDAINSDIDQYYQLFPDPENVNKRYETLARGVYKKLIEKNVKILAVVSNKHSVNEQAIQVSWFPSTVPTNGSHFDQVYFWDWIRKIGEEMKPIVIESIGMKVTRAERPLQKHLNNVKSYSDRIKSIRPETVFVYYCDYFAQECYSGHFPCAIKDSIFNGIAAFKIFINYLLRCNIFFFSDSIKGLTFPEEPYGHPLLLTADNQLRRFEKDAKILKSNCLSVFPECAEYFLHPDMAEVHYSDEYFAPCSDNAYNLSLINKIFSKQLPPCFRTARVEDFAPLLPRNQLITFWKCFTTEPIICDNLPELLKDWALLPSTSGSLYSYSDSLVPVIPLETQESTSEAGAVYYTLQRIGLPFLDTAIVDKSMISCLSCPVIEDRKAILKALFHLHKESDVFDKKSVPSLISYLKKIDVCSDQESLTLIKSLPLFECIDGTFTTLEGKTAYIWPNNACQIGYSTWIEHFPQIAFLNQTSMWRELASSEILDISSLSVEELYCGYILKDFSSLHETERYEHLTHIKNTLFSIIKSHFKHSSTQDIKEKAQLFLDELKKVPCVGEPEALEPINHYYDHNYDIFHCFNKRFPFLPEFFKQSWEEWHEFLKELGLQCHVKKEDFLTFCQEVADGEHKELLKASHVLIVHLLSDGAKTNGWYSDDDFLKKVADIPFVFTHDLSELTWIKDAYVSEQQFVKLNGTAIVSCASLLWTVKPIVDLPLVLPEHFNLADQLGIVHEPDVSDVIQNVTNISKPNRLNFTDFQHFYEYPNANKQPTFPETKSIMAVMFEHFVFLQSKLNKHEDFADTLSHTPCIPVYSTFDGNPCWQIILVKPSTVLFHSVMEEFHPFLHGLDNDFKQFAPLLRTVGVQVTIGFNHLQEVLEMVHEYSGGQVLKQKTRDTVFAALRKLVTLLSQNSTVAGLSDIDEIAEALSPLYLPDCDTKLVLSTKLLYTDDMSFKGTFHPHFERPGYSLLKVKTPQSKLKISEKGFCDLLPTKIRPRGLSTKCSQVLSAQSKKTVHVSRIESTLRKTFKIKMLPKAFAACISYYFREPDLSSNVEKLVFEFFKNIDIITFDCLRVDITFNETKQIFGSIDKLWHLKINEDTSPSKRVLYLDSSLRRKSHRFPKLTESLSHNLLQLIEAKREVITPEDGIELLKVLGLLLTAQSLADLKEILEDHDIPFEEEIYTVTFELGKEIPNCWHHRLDQAIEHLYHPGEEVGHEVMDNHIVLARVLHPILPEGLDSFDQISHVSRKYVIKTHPKDEKGTEVSSIRLYKFLGRQNLHKSDLNHLLDEIRKLPEEGREKAMNKLQRDNFSRICSDLKCQLDEVWKLPIGDRRKAINRLCLKWHPDKNYDVKDVYTFLISEVSGRNGSDHILKSNLDRAARRHKDLEQSTSRVGCELNSNGLDSASAGMPFFDTRPEKDPAKGKQWLKLAETQLKSVEVLLKESQKDIGLCGDVCLMAHQVAEKALKGGMICVYGLDENSLHSRNIKMHALNLQAERPRETNGLVAHTVPLESYNPDQWPPGMVPVDQYTYEQAESAKNHAQAILCKIRSIV